MIEIDLNLKRIPKNAQWKDRWQTFRRGHNAVATNKHFTPLSKQMHGGTGQLTTNTLRHHLVQHGEDRTGLGHWMWARLRGKGGIHTRMVTACRPIQDGSGNPGKVFSQHETCPLGEKDFRSPREAFLEDLKKEIQTWQSKGDLIILGADINENARNTRIHEWARSLHLLDAHLTAHPDADPVATCDKNRSEIPIDAIFISPALDVVQAGMTGFGECNHNSDHRILWIDLDKSSVFGHSPPPLAELKTDKLAGKLNEPKVVKKCNDIVAKQLREFNLIRRAIALENEPKLSFQDRRECELTFEIDRQIRESAKEKCRKLHVNEVDSSDEINRARKEIHLWRLVQRLHNNRRVSMSTVRRRMKHTGGTDALLLRQDETQEQHCNAVKECRKLKKKAATLRQNEFLSRCSKRAEQNKTSVAHEEKLIGHTHKQRNTHRRIRRVTGKDRPNLQTVRAPGNSGQDEEFSSKWGMEKVLKVEGQDRCGQTSTARHTVPFMKGPLLQDFGYLADTKAAEEVLEGTCQVPEGTDQCAERFIAQLKRPDPPTPDWNLKHSTEEHKNGWSKMKAHTASSPFGPTFSDYKAGTKHPTVAEFDACMSKIPAKHGCAPKCWSKALDVMIPKKQDSTHVKKLRTIILFDAQHNKMNKCYARALVDQAEVHKVIPWEAFGSRKRHRAIRCVLNKVPTNDWLRLTHRPGAINSTDAKSCCDRMLHSVASLCMRRLGAGADEVFMMLGTLSQVQHYVRTAHGISDEPCGALEIPPQGVFQGHGAGPAIWSVCGIPVINMLKEAGFGIHVKTPTSKKVFHHVCHTFVDDTDLPYSPSDPEASFTEVLEGMQAMTDCWEGGTRATGGALVPEKSYWTSATFKWERDRWKHKSTRDTPGDVTMLDHNGDRNTIKRLEVWEAEETLGVWVAMDSSTDKQVEELTKKAMKWSDQVRCGHLNRTEAWMSFTGGIMSSLEHPLAATSLSRRDCATIQKPLLEVALPALGCPSTFPRKVLFAPKKFNGLGVPELHVSQAIAKLETWLQEIDSPSMTGRELTMVLESHLLELGVPGQLFRQDFGKLKQLATDSWIKSLWEFCCMSDIDLISLTPNLLVQRRDDTFSIPTFAAHGFKGTQLRRTNLCQLWLQAWTLADMTSGDGCRILGSHWHGTSKCDSTCDWPRAGYPSPACWRDWQEALEKCHSLAGRNPMLKLRRRSGKWEKTAVLPRWRFSEEDDRICKQLENGSMQFFSAVPNHRSRCQFYELHGTAAEIPQDALPTKVISKGMKIRHSGTAPQQTTDEAPAPTEWSFISCNKDSPLEPLIEGTMRGTAICVTDGSCKEQLAAAAMILLPSPGHTHRCRGVNQTPGLPEDLTAHRGELGGACGLIRHLQRLCERRSIKKGRMLLGCDCLLALRNCFHNDFDDPKQTNYDLIQPIRKMLAETPIAIVPEKIKGHLDREFSLQELSYMEKLNVEMDLLAKACWETLSVRSTTRFFQTACQSIWTVQLNGRRLLHWNKNDILDHICSPTVEKCWSKKIHAHPMHAEIDWEALGRAMNRVPVFRRLWQPKWTAGFVPINENMKLWKRLQTSACPRCGEPEESIDHVLRCRDHAARVIWDKQIISLETWLTAQLTHPDLRRGILNALQTWHSDLRPSFVQTDSPSVEAAFEAQESLGDNALIRGFITSQWAAVQQDHYDFLERRNTGLRWLSGLILQFWNISWDMWQHRMRISKSTNSETTLAQNLILDAQVEEEYAAWHNSTHLTITHPHLTRWFSQPMEHVQSETTDYKEQWLHAVRVAKATAKLDEDTD